MSPRGFVRVAALLAVVGPAVPWRLPAQTRSDSLAVIGALAEHLSEQAALTAAAGDTTTVRWTALPAHLAAAFRQHFVPPPRSPVGPRPGGSSHRTVRGSLWFRGDTALVGVDWEGGPAHQPGQPYRDYYVNKFAYRFVRDSTARTGWRALVPLAIVFIDGMIVVPPAAGTAPPEER